MKRLLYFSIGSLLLVLLVLGGGKAAAQHEVTLEPESELWIEGSSTVNRFTCSADEFMGQGRLEDTQAGRQSAEVQLLVRVREFDCGQRRMNRDLHDAMKSLEHPYIRYELDEAQLIEEKEHTYVLQASGRLLIAGAERQLTLTVHADRLSQGRFRARGSQALSMSDFGIDPPTAMLGMIKAHDQIEVHFDLIATVPAGAAFGAPAYAR